MWWNDTWLMPFPFTGIVFMLVCMAMMFLMMRGMHHRRDSDGEALVGASWGHLLIGPRAARKVLSRADPFGPEQSGHRLADDPGFNGSRSQLDRDPDHCD